MAYWKAGNHERALGEYHRAVDWMERVGSNEEQFRFRSEAESVIPRKAIDTFRDLGKKNSAANEEPESLTDKD